MKIMFIIHSLNKVGGAETVLVRLANYFSSKNNHKVILTLLTNSNIALTIEKNIILEQSQSNNIYQQVKNIQGIVEKHKPNIIISFITGINILSIIAAKLTKTPIIISERSSYNYGVNNKRQSLLRRFLYPLANSLVLPTSTESDKYHYVKKIDIIPNPLKSTSFTLDNIKREKIILAVGTLHFVKGFDMLIEAFYRANLSDWKLIILGEGELRKELEKQILQLNLQGSISLLGHKSDTKEYYQKASVFVLSSRSEGYPNVLCEAMSYGCASIAFDCNTGPRDIIEHEKNGLLVDTENIGHLSQTIQYLCKDKKIRNELSKNAQNISQKLDLVVIGKRWENTINNILEKRKKDA